MSYLFGDLSSVDAVHENLPAVMMAWDAAAAQVQRYESSLRLEEFVRTDDWIRDEVNARCEGALADWLERSGHLFDSEMQRIIASGWRKLGERVLERAIAFNRERKERLAAEAAANAAAEAEFEECLRIEAEAKAADERQRVLASPEYHACTKLIEAGYEAIIHYWWCDDRVRDAGMAPSSLYGGRAYSLENYGEDRDFHKFIGTTNGPWSHKDRFHDVCLFFTTHAELMAASPDHGTVFRGLQRSLSFEDAFIGHAGLFVISSVDRLYALLTKFAGGDYTDPWEDDSLEHWLEEFAVPAGLLSEVNNTLYLCGGNLQLVLSDKGRRGERKAQPIRFLVPGLIPKGTVTLLAGSKKAGKSTLATELASVVGDGGGKWAGFDVPASECKGWSILLCGEDPLEFIDERLWRIGYEAKNLNRRGNEEVDLADTLEYFEGAKVSLLVVDPSRKFYQGDEDGSDAPSQFFSLLERFAAEKDCAVVVTHHLKKDARAKSLADVANGIRGSGVFLDRPRMILALANLGRESVFGIPRVDGTLLTNVPHDLVFSGTRRLLRHDESHRHIPVEETRTPTVDEATSEAVRNAIADLLGNGERVTKTGKKDLWSRKLPVLAGMPRTAMRSALDDLIKRDIVEVGEGGALAMGVMA